VHAHDTTILYDELISLFNGFLHKEGKFLIQSQIIWSNYGKRVSMFTSLFLNPALKEPTPGGCSLAVAGVESSYNPGQVRILLHFYNGLFR
jgi:hypothetical protein